VSASDRPLAGVNKVAVATAEQLGDQGDGPSYSGCSSLRCFDSFDDVLSCDTQQVDYYTDSIVALFADLDDAGISECSNVKTKAVNVSAQFDSRSSAHAVETEMLPGLKELNQTLSSLVHHVKDKL